MKVYLAGTGLWIYLTPILGGGIPNNYENILGTRSEQERTIRMGSTLLGRGGWHP